MSTKDPVPSHKQPPPLSLPDSTWYRMTARGNGWILQELKVRKGRVTMKDVGDWDYRAGIEVKALNAIARTSRD